MKMKCPKDFVVKCPKCKSTAYYIPAEWVIEDNPDDFDPKLLEVFDKVLNDERCHAEDDYIYCPKCKTVYMKHYWQDWHEMCEVFLRFSNIF